MTMWLTGTERGRDQTRLVNSKKRDSTCPLMGLAGFSPNRGLWLTFHDSRGIRDMQPRPIEDTPAMQGNEFNLLEPGQSQVSTFPWTQCVTDVPSRQVFGLRARYSVWRVNSAPVGTR